MRIALLAALVAVASASAAAQDPAALAALRRTVRQAPTDSLRQEALHRLASAYLYTTPDSAAAVSRRSRALAERMGNRFLVARADLLDGNVAMSRGELGAARRLFLRARRGYEAAGRPVGGILNNLANVQLAQEDFAGSVATYLDVLRLAERDGDERTVSLAEYNLGTIHNETGDHARALTHFRRSLEIQLGTPALTQEDRMERVVAYLGVGSMLLEVGQPTESRAVFDAALREVRPEDRDDLRVGYLHTGVAHTLRALGDVQQALRHARIGEASLSRSQDPATTADAQATMAWALESAGDPGGAAAAARRRLRSTEASGNRAHQQDALGDLARLTHALGDADAAYGYAARALALGDSLRETGREEAVARAMTRYDTEKAEARAEVAELKLGRQMAWLVAVAAGLLAVLAVAVALYRTAHLRRRANRLLAERNAEIERRRAEAEAALGRTERLLGEREVLLREVHHRVKNNLQLVASLVNLQAGTVRDEATLDALNQMRARVEALALVHRRLYGGDDLRTVNAATYLCELGGSLENAFSGSADVQIQVEAAGVELDADTAVPLGLAATELVANAYKHAFAGGRPGLVRLALEAVGHRLRLTVEDDGVGLPPGLDAPPAESLGLQLAADLAVQLGGTLEMGWSARLGGACATITFPGLPDLAPPDVGLVVPEGSAEYNALVGS